MKEHGIRAKRRRRYVNTTDSNHSQPVAPNILDRQFSVSAPNKAWLSDITYVPTREGWLYLAAVLDLYSRRIVGWAMDAAMPTELVLTALRMAIENRQTEPGLIHHSDRGCQYASAEFQKELTRHGFVCSMSRKGNCWDNAPMESFFGTLKEELIHLAAYATRAEARTAIFEYVETFYNRRRSHSTLGYVSPAEFEEERLAA
jgi:transposase InsO family protein